MARWCPQRETIMKDIITSLVRHLFTFLAGLGTILYSAGLIGADDVQQVNADGVTIQGLLTSITVVILTRLLLKYGGKFLGGSGSGTAALALCVGAGFLVFSLPSCTPHQLESAQAVPIRATYVDKKGNVFAYDPRTGVSIQIIEAAK